MHRPCIVVATQFIPAHQDMNTQQWVEAKYTRKPARNGTFLGWGLDTSEGMGSFTAAIVEFSDGDVELVGVDEIKFRTRTAADDQTDLFNSKRDSQ